MSDPNKDLVAQIARRPSDSDQPVRRARIVPIAADSYDDWNVPVDDILSQSMTETQNIRGRVADAKAFAARWEPRPLPPG